MDTTPPPVTPTPVPPAPLTTSEDKTVAIVSYLTLIGFIVAVILHGNKKTLLGAFHLRQTLGLFLTGLACWVLGMMLAFIPFIGWITMVVIWVGLFVLWLMGLIAAAGGKMTPIPVLGDKFQEWFKNTF